MPSLAEATFSNEFFNVSHLIKISTALLFWNLNNMHWKLNAHCTYWHFMFQSVQFYIAYKSHLSFKKRAFLSPCEQNHYRKKMLIKERLDSSKPWEFIKPFGKIMSAKAFGLKANFSLQNKIPWRNFFRQQQKRKIFSYTYGAQRI